MQVKGEVSLSARRTATGGERRRLWTLAGRQYDYDTHQASAERERPVVVLERTRAATHLRKPAATAPKYCFP